MYIEISFESVKKNNIQSNLKYAQLLSQDISLIKIVKTFIIKFQLGGIIDLKLSSALWG